MSASEQHRPRAYVYKDWTKKRSDALDDVTLKNISVQLTIRGSGKHKQTITKLLALPGGIKNLHFQEQWG